MIVRPLPLRRNLLLPRSRGDAARRLFTVLALVVLSPPRSAEAVNKDVPFVPTPHAVVDRMLDLAAVGQGDLVYDLGCGDGRLVIAAVERGARGVGIDIDPERIAESRANAEKAGVTDRASFRVQNLFEADVSKADVVTLYLLPDVNLKLRPRLLSQLAPGTRVVSHAFDMDEWKPDKTEEVHDGAATRTVYLWVVPARVAGAWAMRDAKTGGAHPLVLEQEYQRLAGRLESGGRTFELEGEVRGAEVQLVARGGGTRRFRGTLEGERLVLDEAEGELRLTGGRDAAAFGEPD